MDSNALVREIVAIIGSPMVANALMMVLGLWIGMFAIRMTRRLLTDDWERTHYDDSDWIPFNNPLPVLTIADAEMERLNKKYSDDMVAIWLRPRCSYCTRIVDTDAKSTYCKGCGAPLD